MLSRLRTLFLMVMSMAVPVSAQEAPAPAPATASQNTLAAQDLQSKAYLTLIEGDEFLKQDVADKAMDCYGRALTMYQKIKELDPNYNPRIIGFRLSYCSNKVKELDARLKGEKGLTSSEAYQQLDELKLKLAALESDTSGLRKKLAEAEARAAKALADVKQRDERITGLEADSASAAGSLRKMADAQAAAEQAATNQVAALLQQLGGLQGQLQKLQAEREAERKELGSEASGRIKMEEAMSALQQEVKLARAELENAKKSESVYQSRIRELEDNARNLLAREEESRARAQGLDGRFNEVKQAREAMEKELAAARDARGALESRLREMEASMEKKVAQRVEEASGQVKVLERALADESAARTKAEGEAREAQRVNGDLTGRLAGLEEASRDPASATAMMEKLRKEHAEDLAAQEKKLADASDQLASMRDQVEATSAKSAADAEIISRLTKATNSLALRMEASETSVQEMKEQVRKALDESLGLVRERDDLRAKLEEAAARLTAESEAHRLTREASARALEELRAAHEKGLLEEHKAREAAVAETVRLAAETNRLEQVRAELVKTNEVRSAAMESLKKEIADAQARAGELSKSLDECTRQRLDIEVQLSNTNQVLVTVRESLKVLEEQTSRKLAEQEALVRDGREQLQVLMGREKESREQSAALTAELSTVKAQLEARQAELKQAGENEKEFAGKLAKNSAEITGLKDGLSKAMAELDALKKELAAGAAALAESASAREREARQLADAGKQIEAKEKDIRQLRKDLKDRTAQLKQLAEQARQFMSNVQVPGDPPAPVPAPDEPAKP
ncbi:MAG: hypothetical protein U1G05_19545 [Kiritimatiellia bacterium]